MSPRPYVIVTCANRLSQTRTTSVVTLTRTSPLHEVTLNNLYWNPSTVRRWVIQNNINYHQERRYLADLQLQEEIQKSQRYQRRLSIVLSAIRDAIADCQKWQEQAKTKGKAAQKPVPGPHPI